MTSRARWIMLALFLWLNRSDNSGRVGPRAARCLCLCVTAVDLGVAMIIVGGPHTRRETWKILAKIGPRLLTTWADCVRLGSSVLFDTSDSIDRLGAASAWTSARRSCVRVVAAKAGVSRSLGGDKPAKKLRDYLPKSFQVY